MGEPAAGAGDAPAPPGLAAVVGREAADLLGSVAHEIGRALDVWTVDVWSFDRDADTLTCRAYWCREPGSAQAGCAGAVVRLDQSHDLRRLVLTAEGAERHLDDDLTPAEAVAFAQGGLTSRIDIPLLAGEEVLGVVSLAERRAVRRLSDEERESLGGLCRMAAGLLHMMDLHERERRQLGRLQAALEFRAGLSPSLGLAEIADAARVELQRRVGAADGVVGVSLRQSDGSYVRLRSPAGGDAAPALETAPADALARQAVDLGRVERDHGADGRARLLVPLAAGGEALGYVEVLTRAPRALRADEVALVEAVAGQTSAAMTAARAYRALKSRSAVDTLTGLYSRWYYHERLRAEVARSRRYKEPLTLLIAALDGYSSRAELRSAPHREAVVAGVARVLRTCVREKVDVPCHLGDGRFALLMPNTRCDASVAGVVARRVRDVVAGTCFSDDDLGELGRFTVRLGCAGYPGHADDPSELAAAAESAASRAGAGRVRLAGADEEDGPA
jgi:diguanylate cyclase (GGDEF)-like protein